MKKYWNSFLSLIYPNTCYNCDVALVEGEDKICLRCFRDFPLTNYHLEEKNPLLEIGAHLPKVHGAFSYLKFYKDGIAQKLLHELKYNGDTSLGFTLGKWFGQHITVALTQANVDFIIPLPLHKLKKRKRGFNQSEIIARGLGEKTGIPVRVDLLRRIRNTSTQTNKGKVERWQNTKQIYELVNGEALSGKNIFLIDDVVTTGATIGSALELLSSTEVNGVYFGSIATGRQ